MTQQEDPNLLLVAGIRLRFVFEYLVMAVLFGAAISAGAQLIASLFIAVVAMKISLAVVFQSAFDAIYYGFIVFLFGFLSAVVVGVPLFEALEKQKFRKAWPFFVAAVIVEMVIFSLTTGKAPVFLELPLVTTLSVLAPGIVIAALFSRRIKPLWLEIEKSETVSTPIVVKLH